MRSHRFAANGLHLVIHEWGGDGPPVLLAHPTGFHGRVWGPLAEQLVAKARSVWSFDFRGHGDSDAPEPSNAHAYSWTGFADDVAAVVRHLGFAGEPALLGVGHSKGGSALLLAEVANPGTFPRLWTYEPIMFPTVESRPQNDEFPLARSARRRRDVWGSYDEVYQAYSSKPPLDVMTAESLHAYVDYAFRERDDGRLELKCRPEVEARVYSMAPNNGVFAKLPAITTEVVVAVGAESQRIDPALGAQIADRLPNGRLEVMEGLGHFGPQQAPDRCAASMMRFAAG